MHSQITVKRPPVTPNLPPSPLPARVASAPWSPCRCPERHVSVHVWVHSKSKWGHAMHYQASFFLNHSLIKM